MSVITGTDGDDSLTGTDGDDVFEASAGNDSIDGLGGLDIVSYATPETDREDGIVAIYGSEFTAIVTDTLGREDELKNIELIEGTQFDDEFIGAAGTQRFRGLDGQDFFDGGDGADWVSYATAADHGGDRGVRIDLGAGEGTDTFGATDTFIDIENIEGSIFDDEIIGAPGVDHHFMGGEGNDTLIGDDGDDLLEGGPGDDVLRGGRGDDTLDGGEGTNTALYVGAEGDYEITPNADGSLTVASSTAPDAGTDTLIGIELGNIVFDDALPPPPPPPEEPDSFSVNVTVATPSGSALGALPLSFTPDDGAGVTEQTDSTGLAAFEIESGASGRIDLLTSFSTGFDGITAGDALSVLRIAVGLDLPGGPPSPLDLIAADINQDGNVTAGDALEVLRAAVGLESDGVGEYVMIDESVDRSGITNGNVEYETGVPIAGLSNDIDLSLTGVRLGDFGA